jgi:hypothetical protein
MINELVPIESKEGVTLYGRVLDKSGRLGQFEVHSDSERHDGHVYTKYSEAERRMSALLGVKSSDNFKQR